MDRQKPTLVIMAAGMGSRFGGLKQIEPVDPEGHLIIDFSLFDAWRAGFRDVVFIIKREMEEDFRACIGDRMEKFFHVSYVYQELDRLPEGITRPEGRTKPWGTGHALACCKGTVNGPFAVINADDFYGREGFKLIHDYLVNTMDEDAPVFDMCMAGYIVGNTLSDNGTVNRGVCVMGEGGYLHEIDETYDIAKQADGKLMGQDGDGNPVEVDGDAIVSMNMFGLPEKYLDVLIENFPAWLDEHGQEMKSEYLLPAEISKLMLAGKATVKVLEDHDRWFGVTYAEDKEAVQQSLQELVDQGVYPHSLY